MEEPQLTYKIGWISGFLVLGIAVMGDLLQVLLSITLVLAPGDTIVTVTAEGMITFYFGIRGVPFIKGKRSFWRLIIWFFTIVIEMVPIVDALPTLTLDTLYNIHSARKDDKDEFDKAHAEWEAQTQRQREQEEFAYSQAALNAHMSQRRELQKTAIEEEEDEQREDA